MTHETRFLIRKFAEKYLQAEVFKSSQISFPINMEKIIYGLKGKIFEDVEDVFSDGYIKYTKSEEPIFEIHIRKISDEKRKRFTLAHEVGHLFLHMDFFNEEKRKKHQIYQDCIYHRKNGNYAEEELQANEFAASFLMPSQSFSKIASKNVIDNGMSYNVTEIANYFQVSNLAAITRGRWLGIFAWDNSF